jgi:hypothetical protein
LWVNKKHSIPYNTHHRSVKRDCVREGKIASNGFCKWVLKAKSSVNNDNAEPINTAHTTLLIVLLGIFLVVVLFDLLSKKESG